jgi:hypothetical protein
MKGEDGSRAPLDGDADLEREAHRSREEGMPCVPPLAYLWDPGEVDPPASSRPRKITKFSIFSTYHSRHASSHYYGIIQLQVLHGIHPNSNVLPTTPAMSSDLYSRTHVKVLWSLAQRSWSTVRRDAHVGRVEPMAPRPGQQ